MDIDSNEVERYLSIACSLAERSTHYKTRVGAILLSPSGFIKSKGCNKEKSHPIQKYFNTKFRNFHEDACHHYLHAEMECLLPYFTGCQPNSYLVDYILWVSRLTRDNRRCLARPCPACRVAISQVGIKTVYYTTESGYCMEEL